MDGKDPFAEVMAQVGRNFSALAPHRVERKPPLPAKIDVAPVGPPNDNCISIGQDERGFDLWLDIERLIDGRLLIQAVSGAGKSWTLRRILEQTASRVPHIVIDPEGEFKTLADELGDQYVMADKLDMASAALLAERARAHRASLVLDLSQLERDGQMKTFAAFISGLVEARRESWTPMLVAIDEAHIFAPFGGHTDAATSVKRAAIGALTDLMSRGRKRGLAGLVATQRLARLAKSVASEAQNVMVGLNSLDLDIRRAAEIIGWDSRRGFDRLPLLQAGEFVAVGRAFSINPAICKVGAVASRHTGAAPAILRPADSAAAKRGLGVDELIERSEAPEFDEESLGAGSRAVRGFIRDPAFAHAVFVYEALKRLLPNGASIANLAEHLERPPLEVAKAVVLLEIHGVVETEERDGQTVARIDHEFAKWRV